MSMEGKVEHKFDMKPHSENLEMYGKLCRERTNKSMVKNRQIQVHQQEPFIFILSLSSSNIPFLQSILHFTFSWCVGKVIDNDRGVHMRPMPGMVGLISSTSKVYLFSTFTCIILLNFHVLSMIPTNSWQEKKKVVPVKQSDVKRTRRDRGELEDIMFKLFERQPNWALKQLVQETDQPAVCLQIIYSFVDIFPKILLFFTVFVKLSPEGIFNENISIWPLSTYTRHHTAFSSSEPQSSI